MKYKKKQRRLHIEKITKNTNTNLFLGGGVEGGSQSSGQAAELKQTVNH
jgi:hypothetical protein